MNPMNREELRKKSWFSDMSRYVQLSGTVEDELLLAGFIAGIESKARANGYAQALEDARLYAKRLGYPSYADFVAAKQALITQYQDGEKEWR